MSAPLIWIVLPAALGVVLYFLRRWYRATVIAGTILGLILAGMAWALPIEQLVNLGAWSFKVSSTLNILGRRLLLTDSERPLLIATYSLTAFWFAAAHLARAGRAFVPVGMVIVALLVAASAVQPFLYAALFIELAVLASVPLFLIPGSSARGGTQRFITHLTLGMPFLLLAGWMLEGVEASPGELTLTTRAMTLLAFGFALLLAIFPFHSWIPMISQEAHPYAAAYVFLMLPWMVSLFGLGFLERYAWLRNTPALYDLLQVAGAIMVLTGGLLAAFQTRLGRMLAYAVMVEIGFSLLAISLPDGLPLYFAMLLPRSLALGIWALALSAIIRKNIALDFQSVQGLAYQMPFAAGSLVLANFTIAGLPLLAGFPLRLALLKNLAGQVAGLESTIPLAILALLGSVGLIAGGVRTLSVLVIRPAPSPDADAQTALQPSVSLDENKGLIVFLLVGTAILILAGLFPQWFFPLMANIAQAFDFSTLILP
ncbi:MAG: hypothetical protein JW726_14205 [Anaerolineales bacterium]|nr:hypothetical protein [Anaerolineales bacterium]